MLPPPQSINMSAAFMMEYTKESEYDTDFILRVLGRGSNPPKSSRRCGECKGEHRIAPGDPCDRCHYINKAWEKKDSWALASALYDVPGWLPSSINSANYSDDEGLLWVCWGGDAPLWYAMDLRTDRWYFVGKEKQARRELWIPFLGATNGQAPWKEAEYRQRVGDVSELAWAQNGAPKALRE